MNLMNKIYLCIDLKSFYASVECVERKLDPFKTNLVVADPSRGKGAICLAVSPALKKRGVKNRCRIFEIPKNIGYITALPRMKKYIEYSANIYAIYLKYIDKNDIHVYSIDEAFLDITNYLKMYNQTPQELAKTIMKEIHTKTGITATCGIGTNLYLTKVALDITAKHIKSNIGYLDETKYKKELWHHKPLTDFWRIGKGLETRLNKLGLYDMYDIAHTDEIILYKEFGINARFLIDHSKGIEPITIDEIKAYKPKTNSISNSQILFEDYNYKQSKKVLTEMLDSICLELVSKNLVANSISITIGYSKDNLQSLKFSKKLLSPTSSYPTILKIVLKEYDTRINKEEKIRKIGVSFGNVEKRKNQQLDLFESFKIEEKDKKLEQTINKIKEKYGKNSILRAVSYEEKATARIRNKLIGGHNAE